MLFFKKNLTDHPGHFVIGIIGKQGVGKSTVLSHFAPQAEQASLKECLFYFFTHCFFFL